MRIFKNGVGGERGGGGVRRICKDEITCTRLPHKNDDDTVTQIARFHVVFVNTVQL